ncbi:MAG: YitT family protein [Blautia sp.]|nr:YitT family protein [Blautia sp.]
MKPDKTREFRRILLCILSGTVMVLNLRTFVHTGGLLPGGFAGLTLLVQNVAQKYAGISIPYGPVYIAMNAFPILLSYRKIGKKFTIYSCITIFIVSFLTDFVRPRIITYDVLLISVFGGMINGFAVSLALNAQATSGGTDFIAIYISEKFGIDSFNYVLIFNAVVLSTYGLLFGWDKALYSIIFQFTSTQVIHLLHKRYQKNTLFIVTDKPDEVTQVINRLSFHGATQIEVVGSYRHTPRTMVYTVISSEERKAVLKGIRQIDEKAFINVMKTDQLSGRFFMRPND